MRTLHSLKLLIQQRLTAAVEELMGHVERTLTEYEEEMENRCRQLLDTRRGREEEEEQQLPAGYCTFNHTQDNAKITRVVTHSLLAPAKANATTCNMPKQNHFTAI